MLNIAIVVAAIAVVVALVALRRRRSAGNGAGIPSQDQNHSAKPRFGKE